MVQRIQAGTRRAAESMDGDLERVRSGVTLSAEADAAIQSIAGRVEQTSAEIGEISSALAEQSAASAEIARNIETIAIMAQEGSVAAGQVSAASNDMDALARTLNGEIGKFRI